MFTCNRFNNMGNECVFAPLKNKLTPCSKIFNHGCFCSEHMNKFFNMDIDTDILVTKTGTRYVATKQVLTKNVDIVLPFPYKFTKKGVNGELITDKICVDLNILESCVARYVRQMTEIKTDVQLLLKGIFTNLMTDGVSYRYDVCESSSIYLRFLESVRKSATDYWRNTTIDVLYTDDTGARRTFKYPMSNMPYLHQIVLQFCESSTNYNIKKLPTVMQPNVALDLDLQGIVIINESESSTVFLKTEETTFSSPLILFSDTQQSTAKVELFNKARLNRGTILENLPQFCNREI